MSSHPLHVRAVGRGARVVAGALALLATFGVAPSVRADELDAAEALFLDGRRLLDEGKFGEACAKLAESHRLEPSIGTLLNLGDCEERQGKFASAWYDFLAAARLAGSRDDGARSVEGLRRAVLLEPKLSYLIVRVDHTVPGEVIKYNNKTIEAEKIGVWLPVDPGDLVITAEAAGRVTFHTLLHAEQDMKLQVEVPPLALATDPRELATSLGSLERPFQEPAMLTRELVTDRREAAAAKKAPLEPPRSSLLSTRSFAGYTAGEVGVASLAIGAIFAALAILESKNFARRADARAPTGKTP
jgi:hypothetical protein